MNSEFDMKRFLSLLAQTSSGHNASRNSVVIASMVTELYARKADAEERLCESVASLCDICNKTVHDDLIATSADSESTGRLMTERQSEMSVTKAELAKALRQIRTCFTA